MRSPTVATTVLFPSENLKAPRYSSRLLLLGFGRNVKLNVVSFALLNTITDSARAD